MSNEGYLGKGFYRRVALTTDWGFETFYVCMRCSATIENKQMHDEFHESLLPEITPRRALNEA